jgi:peroxiredoxin
MNLGADTNCRQNYKRVLQQLARKAGEIGGIGLLVVLGLTACQPADSGARERAIGAEVGRDGSSGQKVDNEMGTPEPCRHVLDLKNRSVDPFRSSSAKVVLLLFVRTDCPIANRYAPELERLYRRFHPQHVACWLVYPDGEAGEIRRHLREYGLSLPALRDPQHELVKRAGVSVTPEAAVFMPGGREVYHGRIDDRCVDFGKERPEATQHDLEEALLAVLGGKPVANASTQAIGCYITESPESTEPKSDTNSK